MKTVWRWGKREIIYLSLHCHHQNGSCIKMGSDESHFNVSLIVKDKVTRQCPQTTTFEEKGELKRIRTEVPLLISLSLTARPNRLTITRHSRRFAFISLRGHIQKYSGCFSQIVFCAVQLPVGFHSVTLNAFYDAYASSRIWRAVGTASSHLSHFASLVWQKCDRNKSACALKTHMLLLHVL